MNFDYVLYYSNCDGNDIWSLYVGYVNIVLNWNVLFVDLNIDFDECNMKMDILYYNYYW